MSNALRLYEISERFQALERLEASEDLPAEVIADTLEALEGDFEAKAVAVAKFVLSLEAHAQACTDAAAAMSTRGARIGTRAEQLRAYLLFHMQAVEAKRIESPEVILTRRKNPDAVIVLDEQRIPAEYWRQPEPPPKKIDKTALKKAIQSGVEVPGAYMDSGERLEIRS